jgi:hypothetical protein
MIIDKVAIKPKTMMISIKVKPETLLALCARSLIAPDMIACPALRPNE